MNGRIGVILMKVRDFDGMVAYYRDVLELPVSGVDPGEGYEVGGDWFGFRLPGCDLELFAESERTRATIPFPRSNAATVAFLVDDFDVERARLASKGVEFFAEGEQEWGRYAHFRDPEGNDLQIYRPNPGWLAEDDRSR
jgi:catechol 2,3-dioxygenase-like lactoylglutathione lyase family enzyme